MATPWTHFLTVTYRQRPSGAVLPYTQLLLTRPLLANVFRASRIHYYAVPELTDNACIHYHMALRMESMKEKYSIYKKVLPWININCGYFKLEKIKDMTNVIEYINKNIEANRKIFDHPNSIFKDIAFTHEDYKLPRKVRNIVYDFEDTDEAPKNDIMKLMKGKTVTRVQVNIKDIESDGDDSDDESDKNDFHEYECCNDYNCDCRFLTIKNKP